MKVRKLEDGEPIEVGDRIRIENYLGVSWQAIHRVTKHYAFVKWNERAEGKFKRIYKQFGFDIIPYQKWNTTRYSVWRPILA